MDGSSLGAYQFPQSMPPQIEGHYPQLYPQYNMLTLTEQYPYPYGTSSFLYPPPLMNLMALASQISSPCNSAP
jgi:hypothetical protein